MTYPPVHFAIMALAVVACHRVPRPHGPDGSKSKPTTARYGPLATTTRTMAASSVQPPVRSATAGGRGTEPAPAGDIVELDGLIAEAIDKHPELERARNVARAQWQVPSRVGSLPDPVFSIAAQNIRFDDPGLTTSAMSAIQFGVLQPLPYPGKLSARSEAAEAMARISDRAVTVLETKVALDVRRAYWRLSLAEELLRINVESERVINSLTDSVITRFAVAMAAQQDTLQAATAHSRVRASLKRHRQVVISARRTLNRAIGRRPTAEMGPVAPLPKEKRPLDRGKLLAQLHRNNPALAVGRADVAAAIRVVDSAEQDRWPDFYAGFMYRFRLATPGDPTEGADMFGLTFGVTLPVWMSWKQDAAVRESRARRRAADNGLSNLDLDVSTSLANAIDEVKRLDEEIRLYEVEVLPQAGAALHASIEDYAYARVGFVSLLQNWQMELNDQMAIASLREQRVQRLADVDALVGSPIPRKKS